MEGMGRSQSHLMVMMPTPARIPMMAKSCQNSKERSRVRPRMSVR